MFALCRRGQSLVEFAIALPLLALLLSGLVAVGWFLYAHVQVANATREAARAGSLYLSNRFHYTSCFATPSAPCPPGYGTGSQAAGGADCWTLTQWVENALVELQRTSGGCPAGGYNTVVHAFGLLAPTKCPNATAGANCWWLEPLTYDDGTAITGLPLAGKGLKVGVTYRYQLPLLGGPFRLDPVSVRKVVIMRIQNP
ncbi:TadE/TadG family type IV pilus assembly protein [Kallotenue papyrolyticum]|uniref:TadE/TadG family type IV pilus assembly protein n=1 Tax=Kallotenue papyrolyticum TaxID=1325125 RepID=UPI0004786770|nr:TadE/TadG family type IV pilus assembly protein [Kallotenue papyrolyticum]